MESGYYLKLLFILSHFLLSTLYFLFYNLNATIPTAITTILPIRRMNVGATPPDSGSFGMTAPADGDAD